MANAVDIAPQQGAATDVQPQPHSGLVITVEVMLYTGLVLLVLLLYLAELGAVPLTGPEAQQAMAAWSTVGPQPDGAVILPESPLLFALQKWSFTLLGGSEGAARLFTALAGIALVFTPLLFRDLLGRTRTFVFVLLLATSPVLLVAARFSSPPVWALLATVLTIWSGWRFRQTGAHSYALLAVTAGVSTILLTDPAAYFLPLVLVGAFVLASTVFAPADSDTTPRETLAGVRSALADVPWLLSAGVAALVIVLLSTSLLTYPAGLGAIGELLGAGVAGIVTLPPYTPPLFVPLVSLFYEPFLWFFAIIAVVQLTRRETTLLDRVLVAWLLLAGLVALLYRGGDAAHAVWLTLPLAALAAYTITDLLHSDVPLLWDVPRWVVPLLATITVGLLTVFALGLQMVARSLTRIVAVEDTSFITRIDAGGAIFVLMIPLFFVVGYLLVSNLWDGRTALRGGGLGLLIFGLLTSLGSGWNAAVPYATNAAELWHQTVTTPNAERLRDTLIEVAQRESRGVPSLPVYVLAERDSVLAWQLRDFTDVTFISDAADANGQPVILLANAAQGDLLPDFETGYVGQDFIMQRTWPLANLRGLDMLAWWTQRQATSTSVPVDVVVLWLRADIYQGVDLLEPSQ